MGGECDFVTDVALHYPLHVIMKILGVPEEDEPRMLKLTQELFGPPIPELTARVKADAQRRSSAAAIDVGRSIDFSTISARSPTTAAPTRATTSPASSPTPDRRPADLRRTTMSYYIIVATAGHDTTSSSTAGAMWALAENPRSSRKVKADPSLIPGLVDEAIRWTTPVKTFMRTATADTEFAGRADRKDDWLMLCYASGNRDEEVFEDPDSSASTASPTSTWPSATAPTCAWASTWPRWRCASSGRSCCRA